MSDESMPGWAKEMERRLMLALQISTLDRSSADHTRNRVTLLTQRLDRLEARVDRAEAEQWKREQQQMMVELEAMLSEKPQP